MKIENNIEIKIENVEHKTQDEIVERLTTEKEKPQFKLYEKIVIGFSAVQAVESLGLLTGTVLANFTDILSEPVKVIVKQSPYVLATLSGVNLMLVAMLFGGFKYKERKDHAEDERVEKEIEDLKTKNKTLQEEPSAEDQALFDELDQMKKEYDVDEESNNLIIHMNIFVNHRKIHKKESRINLDMEMEEIDLPILEKPVSETRNPILKMLADKEGKQEVPEEEPLLRSPGK